MQRVVNFKSGEQLIQRIRLIDITTSHNPRNPAANLVAALPKEGYEGWSLIDLTRLGLSQNEQERQEYCRLIEQYETEPDGILFLASSRVGAEVQPILVRDFRVLDKSANPAVYVTKYGLIAGERRYLAAVYNYAKHGGDDTIGAVVKKMTVEEAEMLAFTENVFRRNPHALEIGEFLHKLRQKINPKTGQQWKLVEIAHFFGLDYAYAVGREALAYLSEEDKRNLLTGKLGLTNAIKKGVALRNGKTITVPDKKTTRRKVLPLSAIQALFDRTYSDSNCPCEPEERIGYRKALAAVMSLTLEEAIAESELREAEEVERGK